MGYFLTQFTAATKPEDVEWLTAFNFSCITRWVPCREMGDLLPSAWAKYTTETKHVPTTRERIAECAYSLEELVRASERVALVKVEKPNAQTRQFTSPARLVESLKGSGSWHSGDVRAIWSDPVAPTQILLFAKDSDPVNPHDCGVIPATPENLRTVKAAVEGAH
jgi:predicted nucleic acid-binding Zn ribbon protein